MAPENNTTPGNDSDSVDQVNTPQTTTVDALQPGQAVKPRIITPDSPTTGQPSSVPQEPSPPSIGPTTPESSMVMPVSPPQETQVLHSSTPPVIQEVTPQAAVTQKPSTDKPKKHKKNLIVAGLVLFFVLSIGGAYLFGKSHERIIIQEPPLKPINLPPQAVVLSNCVAGRGKQYILPKDIPLGPIYDVVNDKVIAVEYNLNLTDIQSNPNALSDTILKLTRDYPVDHFSIVPVTPKTGEALDSIHLIMFVVSKEDVA